MWGEQNYLSFERAVGGIEPPSPRLTVRRCTMQPPLPISVTDTRATMYLKFQWGRIFRKIQSKMLCMYI